MADVTRSSKAGSTASGICSWCCSWNVIRLIGMIVTSISIIIAGFGFAYISMINSYAGFFLFYTSLNILFFALILLLAEIEVNDFFHYFGFLRYFFGRTLIYMMLGIGLIINGISMNIETAVWQAIRIVQFVVGGISLLIALLNLARIAKHGCRGTQDNETGRDTTPRQQLPTTANASRPSTNQAPPATTTQNNPPWQTYQQDQHALADSAADASGPAYTL